jgi:hypothetical protein
MHLPQRALIALVAGDRVRRGRAARFTGKGAPKDSLACGGLQRRFRSGRIT